MTNRLTRGFIVIFIVFIIALLLNYIDQLGTPLLGDWTTITNNWIGVMPYIMLIFMGFYEVLRRR
jgi:hypothetical protein